MNKPFCHPITIDFLGNEFLTFQVGLRATGSFFVLRKNNKTIKVDFASIPMQDIYWDDNKKPIVPFYFTNEAFEKFKDEVSRTTTPEEFNGTLSVQRYDIPPILFVAPLLSLFPKKMLTKILVRNFDKVITKQLQANNISYSTEISEYSKLKENHTDDIEKNNTKQETGLKPKENKEYITPDVSKIRKNLEQILKEYPLPPPRPKLKI